MDLKDFKKIDVTRTHTIFQHPDGHIIHVMHDKLDPAARKQMREIPIEKKPMKLAEGTPEEPIKDEEDPLSQLQQEMQAAKENPEPFAPQASYAGEQPAAPSLENFPLQQKVLQEPQLQEPSISPVESPKAALQGIEQQVKGTQQIAQAQAERSRTESNTIDQAIREKAAANANANENYRKYDKLVSDSVQAMASHPDIDPNRYLGSMDTGGKILTAIGLILGGMGSGLTGGPNLAMDFLQKTIERDIEAQKLAVDKKKTLYGANLQLLKNAEAAAAMTEAQMNDMTKLKLMQAATKSGDKEAMAKAQVAAGQLTAAKEAPLAKLAQIQSTLQLYAKPVHTDVEAQSIVSSLKGIAQKNADSELKRYNDISDIQNTIIPEMERIANLGIAGKAFSFKERADIENLNKKLLTVSGRLASSPDFKLRFSKQLADLLTRPYQISPSSLKVTDLEKLKNLKSALSDAQNKSSKILKGYRINVPSAISAVPIQTLK